MFALKATRYFGKEYQDANDVERRIARMEDCRIFKSPRVKNCDKFHSEMAENGLKALFSIKNRKDLGDMRMRGEKVLEYILYSMYPEPLVEPLKSNAALASIVTGNPALLKHFNGLFLNEQPASTAEQRANYIEALFCAVSLKQRRMLVPLTLHVVEKLVAFTPNPV